MFTLILDILSTPAILLGIVALIGLLAQKKAWSEIIKGTVKAIMGFLVLGGGAGIVVGSLEPFGKMFQIGFGIDGVVPNNEVIVAIALETYGRETALIMFFGMIVNILLARFTPLKYIFLTGHHTMYMAALIAAILVAGQVQGVPMVIIGALVLGVSMVLFPAMASRYMEKIVGSDAVAMGHFSTFGYLVSGWIGKLVGKGSKSTEDMEFPKGLMFLRDTSVAVSLTMTILYLIVAIAAGPTYVEGELSGGTNFLVYALIQGITFAGGVYVILAGVRLVLGEIVPAFKGIATKVVPNAKPALDCPIVYPYAPNAVVIGFLSSFFGGVVGLGVLSATGQIAILPGVVPHFFVGATAGVFGNATGGRRGAVIGAFVNGLIITFLPVLLLPVLGNLGYENTTFGDSDFGIIGILLGNIISLFQ